MNNNSKWLWLIWKDLKSATYAASRHTPVWRAANTPVSAHSCPSDSELQGGMRWCLGMQLPKATGRKVSAMHRWPQAVSRKGHSQPPWEWTQRAICSPFSTAGQHMDAMGLFSAALAIWKVFYIPEHNQWQHPENSCCLGMPCPTLMGMTAQHLDRYRATGVMTSRTVAGKGVKHEHWKREVAPLCVQILHGSWGEPCLKIAEQG